MPLSFRSMSTTIGIRVDPPTSSSRVNVLPLHLGRGQQLPRGVGRALQQVGRHLLELLAGDGDFDRLAGPVRRGSSSGCGR